MAAFAVCSPMQHSSGSPIPSCVRWLLQPPRVLGWAAASCFHENHVCYGGSEPGTRRVSSYRLGGCHELPMSLQPFKEECQEKHGSEMCIHILRVQKCIWCYQHYPLYKNSFWTELKMNCFKKKTNKQPISTSHTMPKAHNGNHVKAPMSWSCFGCQNSDLHKAVTTWREINTEAVLKKQNQTTAFCNIAFLI